MTNAAAVGLLALAVAQTADVQVSARLDRNTAAVGETVHLTVMVQGPGLRTPEIESPDLDGLAVLGTSDRSSFRFSTAAGAVREFSREYTLRVEREGQLTIPPISVSVGGKLYETEAILLRATVADEGTGLPESVGPIAGEEVVLRMWVEPDTAYVGQQVTVTVAAFFDPLVRSRLQRQPEYRPPDVQGVWTADIPGPVRPERRVLNGREYFVQVFRRAVFPLGPGVMQVPPAAVVYEIRRGLIYAPETFQVESDPASVLVRPLPANGQPPEFDGAVGRYEADVRLDRSGLQAGEAVNLTLELRGTGNLSSLGRPVFPEMPNVRVYAGGEEAEVQLEGTELAGRKRFSWVLVPEEPGEYVVPPLQLPFYNPRASGYQVAATDPVTFQVEAATTPLTGESAAGAGAIRYIKIEPGGTPLRLPRRTGFWLVQAIPLVMLLGLVLLRRWRGRRFSLPRARFRRRGSERFRELRELAGSGDARFFAELRLAILEWLQGRLLLPDLATLGVVRTQHALEDVGVPPGEALELIEVLESCSRHRFAPEPPEIEERLKLLDRVRRLLARIDREAIAEKRLRETAERVGARLAVVLMLVTSLGLTGADRVPSPGQATATPGVEAFEQGGAAFDRGDYGVAARAFREALSVRPDDPAILYNLGNAHFEMGQRGRAVAYWVRALQIDPRDEDARFNLRFTVGDDPVVAAALPPLPLSQDELAVLFSVLWFAACGILVAWRRRSRTSTSVAAVTALGLAALALALLLLPRPELAILSRPDAVLRAGPVEQSEALATPAPGTAYQIEERRGEWLRVSRGGREGWVELEDVEVVD